MDCPECGAPGAYVGVIEIRCRGTGCQFYDDDFDLEETYQDLQKLSKRAWVLGEAED